MNKKQLKLIAQKTLPSPIHHWIKTHWQALKLSPPLGKVQLGDLRRLKPISGNWGIERGQPIDRYYIENFLNRHSSDIQGQVLEIGDNAYTKVFGGDRVSQSDVLHVIEDNPKATIIGDLTDAPQIPSDTFDCFVLTQTLQYLYDVRSAVKTIYRILKPGGVLLATFPNISPIHDPQDDKSWGSSCLYWGFTTLSAQQLILESFPKENIQVETYGNVLTATAFLQGLSRQELNSKELNYCDPSYQVLITIRAVKPGIRK
ncbi:class I SAM-dependent methyltransferase [Dolichospermum planctonicum UHCC 0167]|jgi:SAM-dependent methyltransferase|uniref:methyltransferase domain-containing protein n=1 Tax=Dolichospermum planctonicum TaxID=136072 RepID=UPI001443063A|nr:methyltransferase domain-containing protein [Dolichospermum planctonicum]MCW9682206.1 class I SAM-dependent methyltransferase [Dolichospermum planctonicum UHCC 0167]